MNATTTRTRKQARQTHGTCRLTPACNLPLPAALNAGEAVLTITPERGEPTTYTVQRLADEEGRTLGYRLTRLAWFIVDRKVYDIDTTGGYGWQCDCPDAQFHNHECKHTRALRNALAQAGIVVPVPQRQQPASEPQAEPIPEPANASKPEQNQDYYCPECRKWSGSVFCPNCPI